MRFDATLRFNTIRSDPLALHITGITMANETSIFRSDSISRSSGSRSRTPANLSAFLLLMLSLGWAIHFVGLGQSVGSEYFYVDYSKAVNPARLRLYDVSILSPDAEVDLT